MANNSNAELTCCLMLIYQISLKILVYDLKRMNENLFAALTSVHFRLMRTVWRMLVTVHFQVFLQMLWILYIHLLLIATSADVSYTLQTTFLLRGVFKKRKQQFRFDTTLNKSTTLSSIKLIKIHSLFQFIIQPSSSTPFTKCPEPLTAATGIRFSELFFVLFRGPLGVGSKVITE